MINGATNLICLLGHPVKHSFSPNIHNFLFEKYNINCKYMCFDVLADNLGDAVNGIKSLGILGANVTIPHKVDVIKHIDEVSKSAKLIGAVNTIKNEDGKLIGYNTDGIGFVKSILDKGYEIKNKNIMILGCGGGARSVVVELANNGAKSIDIRNRNLDKANKLSHLLNENFKLNLNVATLDVTDKDLENIDILINTTPLGMSPNVDEMPIDENIKINKKILVCDIVYNPKETKFLRWAKNNDLDIVFGKDMLINQALEAFHIWNGIKVDKSEVNNII